MTVRPARLVAFPVAIGLAVVAEWPTFGDGGLTPVVADLAVGLVLVGGGLAARDRRPASRSAVLMALAGAAWFGGAIVPDAVLLHRGPLVQLYLTHPIGRAASRAAQATIVVGYVYAVVGPLAANDAATLALSALVGLTAAYTYARTTGPARRSRAVALATSLAFAGLLATVSVEHVAGSASARSLLLLYDGVIAATALVLVVDLLSRSSVGSTITELVVDLAESHRSDTLRRRLAEALGDPTLVVGYWLPKRAAYIDDDGEPVRAPTAGEQRILTPVADGEERLAVLVHDAAVLDDARLLAAVRSATRLAVSNGRLRAGIEARVADVTASRRRVIGADDAQHKRLELELRDGTESRLERVAALLDVAARHAAASDAGTVARLADDLDHARTDLRDLAHGIHPAVLQDGGLAAALPLLAAHTPVPIDLSMSVVQLPPDIEAAVYFVCCEGLTNVAKHAGAQRVSVEVAVTAGRVVVLLTDDGRGGADPTGSGLRGLADRVEAFGGHLDVDGRPGGGTKITASIPIP